MLVFCLFSVTIQFLISVKTQNAPFEVQGQQCQRCVPVEECPRVGQMSQYEQKQWLRQSSCKDPAPREDFSFLFGFSPLARGDFICCPTNGIQENNINTRRRQNRFQNGSRHRNNFNNGFNPNQRTVFNRRQQNLKGYQGESRPVENSSQSFQRNHYKQRNMTLTANYTESTFNQCNDLNSFPPLPSTRCCGIDESDNHENSNISSSKSAANGGIERAPTRRSKYAQMKHRPMENFGIPWMSQPAQSAKHPSRPIRSADTTQNVTIVNRISGGTAAELNQFPWTVLLKATFRYGQRTQTFNCGGSLISARYVLTAAHCVQDNDGVIVEVKVYLSEYDKRTFPRDCKNNGGAERCVENVVMIAENVIPHPQYDDTRLQNDIALIRLRTRTPYTEFIRPICLPPVDIDNSDLKDLPLAVAGWGRNGPYESDIKQYTVIHLVPQAQCKKYYGFLTKKHLCAVGYTGEDTCKGDSGGPLMLLFKGQYYVSGIVSGKRSDSPCGTAIPSLYTNVFTYLEWIQNNIKS